MCFPEESYDYDAMCKNSIFIGAYDGDICIGLAIMQHAFFEYMYDLKVNEEYRRRGIAKRLLDKAEEDVYKRQVLSIKNPYAGTITVPAVGEIIRDDPDAKGKIVIRQGAYEMGRKIR